MAIPIEPEHKTEDVPVFISAKTTFAQLKEMQESDRFLLNRVVALDMLHNACELDPSFQLFLGPDDKILNKFFRAPTSRSGLSSIANSVAHRLALTAIALKFTGTDDPRFVYMSACYFSNMLQARIEKRNVFLGNISDSSTVIFDRDENNNPIAISPEHMNDKKKEVLDSHQAEINVLLQHKKSLDQAAEKYQKKEIVGNERYVMTLKLLVSIGGQGSGIKKVTELLEMEDYEGAYRKAFAIVNCVRSFRVYIWLI